MEVTVLKDSSRTITSNKTGKPVDHRFQEIFVRWSHEPFPRPCQIYLGDDQAPYPPGKYELDVEKTLSIQQDKLMARTIVLQPLVMDPPRPNK